MPLFQPLTVIVCEASDFLVILQKKEKARNRAFSCLTEDCRRRD